MCASHSPAQEQVGRQQGWGGLKQCAPVQQREVDLLEHLLKLWLQQHHALAIRGFPHIGEVVDAVAPARVHQRNACTCHGFRAHACLAHPDGDGCSFGEAHPAHGARSFLCGSCAHRLSTEGTQWRSRACGISYNFSHRGTVLWCQASLGGNHAAAQGQCVLRSVGTQTKGSALAQEVSEMCSQFLIAGVAGAAWVLWSKLPVQRCIERISAQGGTMQPLRVSAFCVQWAPKTMG